MADHPPPWAWLGRPGDETHLLDGNGYSILSPCRDDTLSTRSPAVREQLRAAPEMETLLLETLRLFGEPHPGIMEFVPCEKCVHVSEVRALLKRLDAARKAGG